MTKEEKKLREFVFNKYLEAYQNENTANMMTMTFFSEIEYQVYLWNRYSINGYGIKAINN